MHIPRGISAALAITLVMAGSARAEGPVRRALLVGINNYQYATKDMPSLRGAEGDADWLKSILVSRFGFRYEDVVVLKEDATRANIIEKFRTHLIDQSKNGDLALFYFAGHGSQRLTPPYTVPPATIIETTIIPRDGRDPRHNVFDITESELHTLFTALLKKTPHAISILDACFSAITVRGDDVVRAAPPDTRERPASSFLSASEVTRDGIEGPANPVEKMVRIAASGANQWSWEIEKPKGSFHGSLSFYLFSELAAADATTTWRDVMIRTADRVRSEHGNQEPQMLPADREDERLFGGAGLSAKQAYFTAQRFGQNVQLQAGSIHTISEGTQLAIYPPGETEFTGDPVATVEVSNVKDTTSMARMVFGDIKRIEPESRAVVRVRPASAFHFRVFLEGVGAAADSTHAQLAKIPDVLVTPEKNSADAVVRFAGGAIHLEHPDGTVMSEPISAEAPDAAGSLISEIGRWTEWKRNLDSAGAPPALKIQVLDAEGNRLPSALVSGTRFRLLLCNTGTAPVYARIFLFSSDGKAEEFTGFDLYGKPLPPSLKCVGAMRNGTLTIALPEGRKSGTEYIKVYATQQPVQLDFLHGKVARDDATWSADRLAFRLRAR